MAGAKLGNMNFGQLHGIGGGDDSAGQPVEGSPSGTGNPKYDAAYTDPSEKLQPGESAQAAPKIPGQPDAGSSGIPSPITTAARNGSAFQGKPTQDTSLSQPTDIPHGDILRPGPNYKVQRPSYGYVDPATGVPMDTNADTLDRQRGKLKTDAERQAFDVNHPKGNYTAISDDDGKLYDSMPLGSVGDAKRDLAEGEEKGILDKFYQSHGQKGNREYTDPKSVAQ